MNEPFEARARGALRLSMPSPAADEALAAHLVRSGRITPTDASAVRAELRERPAARLADVLVGRGLVSARDLLDAAVEMAEGASQAGSRPVSSGRLVAVTPAGPAGSGLVPVASPIGARGEGIGRYAVGEELGRGGMGVVYRAFDPGLDRAVAIKVLGTGEGALGEQQLRRFEREARTAARLRHPGIVAVHEVGWDPGPTAGSGRPFLVMDLIEGESLEEVLRRDAVPPRRVAAIVRDVARALQHAHEHDVIHRDVKPENILVEPGGRVLITDFGLARDAGEARVTLTGQMVGTPAYMAPEQASSGRGRICPETDVYALGGVLYRGLAGRPPFIERELLALIRKVLVVDPAPLRAHRPHVHPDLETIAAKCLEKDPLRRYGSASELADELQRFVDGELIHARPISRVGRMRRWAGRNRLLAAATTAVGVLLVAFAGLGVRMAAELRRAAEAERESLADEAGARARDAFARFQNARADAVAVGISSEEARMRRDRLLARGLEAVQAAATHRALAPDDDAARRSAMEALLAYGEMALETEQWAVAASAVEQAQAVSPDDPRAGRFLDRLGAARREASVERREAVEAVIARVRDGEASGERALEHALFELVRYPERQTVQLLVAALDDVTERLWDVALEAYGEAAIATEEEERTGAKAIAEIEEILERHRAAAEAGEDPDDEDVDAIERVERRIVDRAVRRRRFAGNIDLAFGATGAELIGSLQERSASSGELDLARVTCRALGRIGIAEGAVEALARYLAVERDERRAAVAGEALCLLGGSDAGRVVIATQRRLGYNSTFSNRILGAIRMTGLETVLPLETVEGRFTRARLRHDTGELAGALEDMDRAIELAAEGEASRLWNERGLILRELDRPAEALAAFDRAISLDPRFAGGFSNRGNLHREMGDLIRALGDCRRAVEIDPRYADGWINLGIVHATRGERAEAVDAFSRSVELAPTVAAHRFNLAIARKDAGDRLAALADVSRAIDLLDRDARYWSFRSELHAAGGTFDAAFADASRALELDPGLVDAWIARGVARRSVGDMESAHADLARALEIRPRHTTALIERGVTYAQEGDLEAAIGFISRALQIDANLPRGWLCRGNVRQLGGDVEGAILDYGRAIEIAPRDPVFWNARCDALVSANRLDEAAANAEEAVRLDPGFAVAWNNLGRIRTRRRDLPGARDAYTRAIEASPRYPLAWCNRGRVRAELGDVPGALADLDRAIELDPDDANSRSTRAELRLPTDIDGAAADATAALAIDPRAAGALRVRGYARTDLRGKIADLERYLELEPTGKAADEVRVVLARLRGR